MHEDLAACAKPAPLMPLRGWAAFLGVGFVLIVLVPLLNLLPASGSAAQVPDYLIPLLGKYACTRSSANSTIRIAFLAETPIVEVGRASCRERVCPYV